MGNGHGGSRKGAGRKSTRERFPVEVEAAESKIAAQLESILRQQVNAALVGQKQVSEVSVPAAMAVVLVTHKINGVVQTDENGKPINVRVHAFPDLAAQKPDQMVVIRHSETWLPPNLGIGASLIDRVVGRPSPLTDPNDGEELPIPADAAAAVARIYGQLPQQPVTESEQDDADGDMDDAL